MGAALLLAPDHINNLRKLSTIQDMVKNSPPLLCGIVWGAGTIATMLGGDKARLAQVVMLSGVARRTAIGMKHVDE